MAQYSNAAVKQELAEGEKKFADLKLIGARY
jgi:hypothetical protein